MRECNVVLISLYRNQNFAIRTLHSVLKGVNGINLHSIFFKESWANLATKPTATEEQLFMHKIIDLTPTVVCISVLSSYVPIAKKLTRLIRNNSSALIVWGGVHPTICPESCIKEVDIICRGEGEGALVDLVERLRDGKEYLDVKNLWINNKGNIIKNPMRPLIVFLFRLMVAIYFSLLTITRLQEVTQYFWMTV
jgi:anaerobic magnesium-protoporphyrin IX monomethyl ester cyclase